MAKSPTVFINVKAKLCDFCQFFAAFLESLKIIYIQLRFSKKSKKVGEISQSLIFCTYIFRSRNMDISISEWIVPEIGTWRLPILLSKKPTKGEGGGLKSKKWADIAVYGCL